ncbi:fam-a protein [Plasmodium vinckei brucechwatti]|uniref:Fam-a protein n=1 Tax=Plasmodium vinckei brucechwatti TaxID=119398 RepID=A0A6V7RYA1_PLAVN|nr:fam-a protein [Plasmodium vinckei brucechwatti]
MKAISLGLISSIIFSIVLAENNSISGAITCCFPFFRKKTKKSRKMTYEPIKIKDEYDPDIPNLKYIDKFTPITLDIYKGDQSRLNEPFISETDGAIVDEVTGFLRRENDSRRQGYYIKPNEEDYEHMIKTNFIPLKNNYQYNQMNAHKKDDTPHAVPKASGNQEFIEERKLSTINEENSNALDEDNENDEIYQKNKHLLCANPEEIIKASELMNEVIEHLEYHATNKDGYKLRRNYPNVNLFYYKKKHEGHTNVLKSHLKIYGCDKYDQLINEIWDPDCAKIFDVGFVTRKFARVYNPNTVIMQQRCKYWCMGRQEYFYALAAKAQKSENKTIIAMTSANINDHNPSKKKYQNRIIENANLFKIDIDSEDDIRKGKLKKKFVNLAGYLIEKRDTHIYITYVESVNGRPTI